MLLRRTLPRLPAACAHGLARRRYCAAPPAAAAERRNALKLLQGLLKKEHGKQRGWRRRRPELVSPEAWELVENLAGKRQLKAAHCTAVLSSTTTPAEVGRMARIADDAGLESDTPVVRTLFKAWCRCGHYAYAVAVLQDAVERGVIDQQGARVLATKPLAAAVAETSSDSWQFFRLLQAANLADRFHYNIMLPLCTPVGNLSPRPGKGHQDDDTHTTVAMLLTELQNSGGKPSTDTFNTRLTIAVDTGGASEGSQDSARAAAALVSEMRQAGVMPDAATYSLLHTCYLGASPIPSAAAAADVLAEARTVVPREFSATEVSSTATLALRELCRGDSPDLAWEYFSALQVGGIADGYHLSEVMHLCEDLESLDALVAQATLTSGRMNRRRDNSNGALELAMHQHLVRLGKVQRAVLVIADFAQDKHSEPYKISTSITAALRKLCQERSPSDAWEYFGAIQQRGLADIFHYNTMLQQCNTMEGVETLLGEMNAAGVLRDQSTTRALHMTWAQLGDPLRAFTELAAGIEGGTWPSLSQRKRVVGNCLAVLLHRDAPNRNEVVFAYLSHIEDHGMLLPFGSSAADEIDVVNATSPVPGASAPLVLSDEPYATLLRVRSGEESNSSVFEGKVDSTSHNATCDTTDVAEYAVDSSWCTSAQKLEAKYWAALLDHLEQRPEHVIMDGRGSALLLRRAAACCAPDLAARALRIVQTDRISRSKLATSTLRSLVEAATTTVDGQAANQVTPRRNKREDKSAAASEMVTGLLNEMIEDGLADTYQYNIGLRHSRDSATVAGWLDSMVKNGHGDKQTLHLLHKNWSDIAVDDEWQRQVLERSG